MSNFDDSVDETYDEGEMVTRECDFCKEIVDWTEPVESTEENGNFIELRSCLMCSFGEVFGQEQVQALMNQMKMKKT
ncbi:MAG: hypothetical protein K6T94_09000 [Paenibacillus sp.]|nr:hypothetical protein [Paenibacillus sp.]